MSRKATEKSCDVDIVIAQIREYLNKKNMNELELSRAVGVSQSALNRFLTGGRKSVTKVARRCMEVVCNEEYWNKQHNNYAIYGVGAIKDNSSIDGLIESIKRGDPGSIEMAVSILDSLKPVLDLLALVRGSSEGGN